MISNALVILNALERSFTVTPCVTCAAVPSEISRHPYGERWEADGFSFKKKFDAQKGKRKIVISHRGQKWGLFFWPRGLFAAQKRPEGLPPRSDIWIWTFFANAHLQGCLRICFGPHVRGFEARLSPAEAGLSYPATVTRWLAIFLLKSSIAKFLHIHSFIRLEFI